MFAHAPHTHVRGAGAFGRNQRVTEEVPEGASPPSRAFWAASGTSAAAGNETAVHAIVQETPTDAAVRFAALRARTRAKEAAAKGRLEPTSKLARLGELSSTLMG